MPIIDAVAKYADEIPRSIAVNIDGCTLDYAALYAHAQRFRYALATIDKRQNQSVNLPENGRLVLLALPNHHLFAEIFTGASASPHCVAVLSVETPAAQITEIIKRLQPDLIVCDKADSIVGKIAQQSGARVLAVDDGGQTDNNYERFLQAGAEFLSYEDRPDHPFFIGFTSGTTGLPKAFIRTRDSWRKSLEGGRDVFALKPMQNTVAPGPMAHGVTLYALAECLDSGQTFYGVQHFEADKLLAILPEADRFIGVPTMLTVLCKAAETNNIVFPRLGQLVTGASKFDKQHFEQAKRLFPSTKILQYYGASELSFVAVNEMASALMEDNAMMSPVGQAFPGVKVSIRDQNGKVCACGDIGTIFVESALIAIGYLWGDNGQSFKKTAYGATVGDLGVQDENGNLFVLGRAGNMIISGGNNIYLAEIETALKAIDGIEDAVAFGLDDDIYGQRLVAVIRFENHARLSKDMIIAACLEQLPKFKLPREFYVIDTWPMTWSGKIARMQVMAMLEKATGQLERL